MKTTLQVEVEYDETVTDPEALATALDILLETAISTPGVLEEYGNPTIGEFLVAEPLGYTPTDLEEILQTMADQCVEEEALDELVHELASTKGSEVNNEGMEAQVRYLLDAYGVDRLWLNLEDAKIAKRDP